MSLSNILSKGVRYLTDKGYRFAVNRSLFGMYRDMPDDEYLKRLFRYRMGYELNLDNPKTFNEKLQWLKLHDRRPQYTTMVDKYAVKAYVAERVGEKYIIPTLGVWNHFDEIDFDILPDQFVLKCTHDSGGLIICRDKGKIDIRKAKKKIEQSLKQNFYYWGREWPYKNVIPRVIAEEYMEDEYGRELKDYKVLCFNGVPKLIELHSGRYTNHHTQDFYDTDWNKLTISQTGLPDYQVTSEVFPRPNALQEMISLSRVLAENIPHIRVDWYLIHGQLFFGELTFFDGSGFVPFDDPKDDLMMGDWITLP